MYVREDRRMILVIDIGNTTIALTGLREADRDSAAGETAPRFTVKVPTETGRDPARFADEAGGLLREYFPEKVRFDIAAVSSVVPACTPAALAFADSVSDRPPVLISCHCDTGLCFDGLPAPDRIGADRIADAAWAACRCPLPAMTADLGTATTINIIGPAEEGSGFSGLFLGGMIGAGVRTSLQALRSGTAQLPALEPKQVPKDRLIGRDTDGCMLSSAVIGTAAMIEGLAERVEEQLGSPVTLILTGGNADFVTPWIRRQFIREPALAAKGAAVIALRQIR